MDEQAITVFVAPGCPQCEAARQYLRQRQYPTIERDVTADSQAMGDLVSVAGVARVPTLVARDHVMIGFDPALLEDLLIEARAAVADSGESAEAEGIPAAADVDQDESSASGSGAV